MVLQVNILSSFYMLTLLLSLVCSSQEKNKKNPNLVNISSLISSASGSQLLAQLSFHTFMWSHLLSSTIHLGILFSSVEHIPADLKASMFFKLGLQIVDYKAFLKKKKKGNGKCTIIPYYGNASSWIGVLCIHSCRAARWLSCPWDWLTHISILKPVGASRRMKLRKIILEGIFFLIGGIPNFDVWLPAINL